MTPDIDVRRLIESITRRAVSYLAEEVAIETRSVDSSFRDAKKLVLRDLTSLVCVGGENAIYISFSFDRSLIGAVLAKYAMEIEIPPGEEELFLEEAAGDTINTVVGNALADVSAGGPAIYLTPPVILNEARGIARTTKHVDLYEVKLDTSKGTLSVMAIGSTELFGDLAVRGVG